MPGVLFFNRLILMRYVLKRCAGDEKQAQESHTAHRNRMDMPVDDKADMVSSEKIKERF